MKYKCRKCGKDFDLPATITYPSTYTVPTTDYPLVEINWPYTAPPPRTFTYTYSTSVPCCPHCYSTEIEETKEEA